MPDIKQLIPQRDPIVEVDELLEASETEAVTRLTVREDNYFVHSGVLQEPGLIEHMAQSAAAFAGNATFLRNEPPHLGFIGEIKRCRIMQLPIVGSVMTTTVSLVSEIAGVSLVKIAIACDSNPVAECQMKIFLKE